MRVKLLLGFCSFAALTSLLIYQIYSRYSHSLPPASSAQPQPTTITVGQTTKVKYPQDYTLVLVGDSMTELMGNSDELKIYLNKYYPNKSFEVLNYGFGSTNILSVQQRLEQETFHGRIFRAILNIDFDLILIESFGHNPLSQYPLEVGLNKQAEALDKIISSIRSSNPQAKVVFVATIAPNKKRYASNQVDLTEEQRAQWASERIAYIKNHITYAQAHNLHLINIFERSQENGDGKLELISTTDYIHPSPKGIYFISEEIANFIYQNNLLNR